MTIAKKSACAAIVFPIFLVILSLSGCVNSNNQTDAKKSRRDITSAGDKFDFSKPQKFIFDESPATTYGIFPVTANSVYNDERAFYFGFDLDTRMTNSGQPFYFSVQAPEGNYRVTVELGHSELPSSTTLKAETRRLYLHNLTTVAGEYLRRDFVVNVRNSAIRNGNENVPGETHVSLKDLEQHRLHWDEKLTLEFNGDHPRVRSITLQKAEVPTIFLVGDSTVTDQPREDFASWGQMLPLFFDRNIAIANHAESGESMKSFMTSLRLAKVLDAIKAGDYLFIQFGHNDQKKFRPLTYVEAETTYRDYLKVFISEARLRGATPVLITSMQRRTFDDAGKIVNSHGTYPTAVREVAKEMKVALIDLDHMSTTLYEALGIKDAPGAFGDHGKDGTHHNSYGAYQLAQCVVQGIRTARLPLTAHLINSQAHYDPNQPDSLNEFNLHPSPGISSFRPDGN